MAGLSQHRLLHETTIGFSGDLWYVSISFKFLIRVYEKNVYIPKSKYLLTKSVFRVLNTKKEVNLFL